MELLMPHIIMLNGPPRSGKDTIGDILCSDYGAERMKFAHHLFEDLKKLLNLSDEQFRYYREEGKDEKVFNGLSLREVSINYSENVIIPRFGPHFWAKCLLDDIKMQSLGLFVVTDLGFDRELDYFDENWPEKDLTIVKIMRDGCDFSKDSRDYVRRHDLIIENNGSINELYTCAEAIFESIYGVK